MKKINTLFIFLFFATFLFAQTESEPCGAISYTEDYLSHHPEEEEKLLEVEAITQQWINEHQNSVLPREVITIPVVVHLVLDFTEYKINDFEIQAQIEALTADFRKQNSNQAIIPEEFKDRAADVEIEFCLASRDPNGLATDGITKRYNTETNFGEKRINGLKRAICYENEGGQDAWNPNHYLNIWVGEMQSIDGEATFPGMARVPEEDGVWIDPRSFTFFCGTETHFYLGRTLTHEVGHYFNLLHIFGVSEDCTSDDGIDDTPAQQKRNTNCPEYPKMNVCDSLEPHEMTVNFMDYVDDDCMAMFTNGQKTRMLAALHTVRSGLKDSQGCSGSIVRNNTLKKNKINIFPMPASDCIHVDLQINPNYEIRIELVNSAGQRLYTERLYARDIRSIDLSPYPNGIYFILFENGSNFASKKIVINK